MVENTQVNGLPIQTSELEAMGMHHFGDSSTWTSPTDSSWVLDPTDVSSPYHGKAIRLVELKLKLSENIVFTGINQLLVEFYISGNPSPVKVIAYKNLVDWIDRSEECIRVEMNNDIGSFHQYNVRFAFTPVIWTSTGLDAEGGYKLNKMVVKIADDTPYISTDGDHVKVAVGRYFAEIYEDPNV